MSNYNLPMTSIQYEMYFLYRHIRPDTNQVFYIGTGKKRERAMSTLERATSKRNRNKYWANIVNKNNGNYIKEGHQV